MGGTSLQVSDRLGPLQSYYFDKVATPLGHEPTIDGFDHPSLVK